MEDRNTRANDKLFDRPRQALQSLSFIIFAIWQTMPAALGLVLYFILVRLCRFNWKLLLPITLSVWGVSLYFEMQRLGINNIRDVMIAGWRLNVNFWYLSAHHSQAWEYLYHAEFNWLIGIPFLLLGIFSVLELIPNSAHEKRLRSMQNGSNSLAVKLNERVIQRKLQDLKSKPDAAALGVSLPSGKAVYVLDAAVNQVLLVLGTTGAGKTVTLWRFSEHAAAGKHPQVIINGKPDADQIAKLEALAKRAGIPFFCFGRDTYDFFTEGDHTELKDKMICLKDEWSSDYYRSLAENYLQTVFAVLLARGERFTLKDAVSLLDYKELARMVRQYKQSPFYERVTALADYQSDELKGLKAHFEQLLYSEMGQYLTGRDSFSLRQVIEQNGIAYFPLPALKYPAFAKMLGKLVINDIKTVIERGVDNKKLFTLFDEFSVFAGDQVLNLINMGRGKGVHTILGTQGIGDLQQVSAQFADQVLNCVNTLIAHRVNDQCSAEKIAEWAGTKEVYSVTAQVTVDRNTGAGSVQRTKEFIIHPDLLKQGLKTGEAIFMTKYGEMTWDKVRVKYS